VTLIGRGGSLPLGRPSGCARRSSQWRTSRRFIRAVVRVRLCHSNSIEDAVRAETRHASCRCNGGLQPLAMQTARGVHRGSRRAVNAGRCVAAFRKPRRPEHLDDQSHSFRGLYRLKPDATGGLRVRCCRTEFATDSALEGTSFELVVPASGVTLSEQQTVRPSCVRPRLNPSYTVAANEMSSAGESIPMLRAPKPLDPSSVMRRAKRLRPRARRVREIGQARGYCWRRMSVLM